MNFLLGGTLKAFLSQCMCVCMHMCVQVHKYRCVCVLVSPYDSLRTCPLGTLSAFDRDRPLIGPKLPVRLVYNSVSTFLVLEFQVHNPLGRYWGSDLGP